MSRLGVKFPQAGSARLPSRVRVWILNITRLQFRWPEDYLGLRIAELLHVVGLYVLELHRQHAGLDPNAPLRNASASLSSSKLCAAWTACCSTCM